MSHPASCVRVAHAAVVLVEHLVRHGSVCSQLPRGVGRDSWADWHRIHLLQLLQQGGHVPCVHKAALHRGRHPAGNVTPSRSNTPIMTHGEQSDKFPLGNIKPRFAGKFLLCLTKTATRETKDFVSGTSARSQILLHF